MNRKGQGRGPAGRKTGNRKKSTITSIGAARFRGGLMALLMMLLGGLGIWQCIDSRTEKTPSGDTALPLSRSLLDPGDVDAGDHEVDPTVLNESAILEEEIEQEPEPEPEPEPSETVGRSIAQAGEDLGDTDTGDVTERFPLFAVAFHFHTQIRESDDHESRVIAYARRGATFRVSERVSTRGCSRGWHEVAGGGFVCDGTGVNVARTPVTFEPSPPPPDRNAGLPYAYAYTRRSGVAEYWRIPTAEEVAETEKRFRAIEQRDAGGADSGPKDKPRSTDASAYDEAALQKVLERALEKAALPPGEEPPLTASETMATISAATEVKPDSAGSPGALTAVVDTAGQTDEDLFALPRYVHMRMEKGYYVSVWERLREDSIDWTRTIRGRFVRSNELIGPTASSLEGQLLNERVQLPLVFVIGDGASLLRRDREGGSLRSDGTVERYQAFPWFEDVRSGSNRYHRVGENRFVNRRVSRVARQIDPPANVGVDERWIHVDLAQQVLVAYEGAMPVFATLVATGKPGYETPTGEFRVQNKHVTVNMANTTAGAEAYSIEDVPWTQFFHRGYGLHAAFWHDRFGRVRSHGCINLSPADARRLFYWSGPHVPAGYHGYFHTRENPGTRIVITD